MDIIIIIYSKKLFKNSCIICNRLEILINFQNSENNPRIKIIADLTINDSDDDGTEDIGSVGYSAGYV